MKKKLVVLGLAGAIFLSGMGILKRKRSKLFGYKV